MSRAGALRKLEEGQRLIAEAHAELKLEERLPSVEQRKPLPITAEEKARGVRGTIDVIHGGRFRVRVNVRGRRCSVGVFDTVEAAEECRRQAAGLAKDDEPCVYFIAAVSAKRIKIGWTNRDPEQRIADLQVGCPYHLELLAYIEGGAAKEKEMHRHFARYRLARGEWFEDTIEMRAMIRQLPCRYMAVPRLKHNGRFVADSKILDGLK